MKDTILSDLYRYDGETNLFRGFFKNPGFLFSYYLRKSATSSKPMFWVYKILLKHLSIKYGYEISEKCSIGKGLAIMHLGGIAINHNAEIGKHCTIYQGVTVGGDVGRRLGSPTIGNKVWIGPNAVITGNITIGNNVLIAGNAFVNFDVPSNSLVIGNPGVIKSFNKIDNYIQYVKEG